MGVFVANVFDAVVSVSQGVSAEAPTSENDNGALGYDVYFWQTLNGKVTQIEYDSADSAYYVNVKISAINALQTYVLGGSTLVSDPAGTHTSTFVAIDDTSVSSSFDQTSFRSFMDPSVTQQNVLIKGTSLVELHPDGYIVSASNQQDVLLVQHDDSANSGESAEFNGFDAYMGSTGNLKLSLLPSASPRLSSSTRPVGAGKNAQSLLEAAQALHHAQLVHRAADVASQLPELLAQLPRDPSHRIFPLLQHSRALVRAIRGLPVSQNQLVRTRHFRLLVAAGVSKFDLFHRFGKGFESDMEKAVLYFAASTPAHSVTPELNLPFNRTGSSSGSIGGKSISLSSTSGYLIGTNLNCNNSNFAYEAEANANATLTLFGASWNAFTGSFVYGKNGGVALADSVSASVFGKSVYNRQLPSYGYCKAETLPLGQITKGVHVAKTFWVSIVPVSFTAAASVELTLDWDWSICSNTLSASVGIEPGTVVTVDGATEVDLLVLRAGVSIDADLAAKLSPEVFIAGTACDAGVKVTETISSVSASLDGFYQFRKCKWLFWDCKWEKEQEHTFWSHSEAPSTKVLDQKTFPIHL